MTGGVRMIVANAPDPSLDPANVRPSSSTGGKERARKRILIMMSNTGGGHRASAEAIKAAFQEKYGDEYEVGPQCVCLERGWACCEVHTSQGQLLRRKERRCRCTSAACIWLQPPEAAGVACTACLVPLLPSSVVTCLAE